MEVAPAGPEECALRLDGDFLECLQAVAYETRADDVHPPGPAPPERFERAGGVGPEPLGAAEARLERDAILVLAQPQRFSQQPPGRLAFAVIGITLVERC